MSLRRSAVREAPRAPRRGRLYEGFSPAQRERASIYWPFVLPALFLFVVLFVVPAVYTGWVSLVTWRGSGDQVFVGFKNYILLWRDPVFVQSFWNTLSIVFICGAAVFAVSFLVSSILRELKIGQAVQTILFFPYMLSSIAVGITFSLIFVPDGLLNASLRGVGLGEFTEIWLAPDKVWTIILIGIVWVSSGFYILLMMAGIGRIPQYYYEQAQLDGAGRFRTFLNVTVPLTWDIISISVVFWMMGAVKVFEFVYGFAGGGSYTPPPETRTLAVEQFLMTTGGPSPQYAMGMGSAIGVVMLALITLLVVLGRRVMRRESLEF